MKSPEIVNATQAELDEIPALAKPAFPQQQYQRLEAVLGTFVYVMQSLQNAKTSLKRFRRMLFGARTESRANVLQAQATDAPDKLHDARAIDTEPAGDTVPALAHTSALDAADDGAAPSLAKPAKPGHGRIGAQAYRDAPGITLEPSDVSAGDLCPQCMAGKVYDSTPRTIVKVTGQPPLAATVYELRRLRCRLCDAVFSAALPEGVAEAAGIEPEGKAINTSGIVAVMRAPQGELKAVLFFTGHAHAGDNLARVLAQRSRELAPPMHMCDALASNMPGDFATVLCNCLAHGRRQFVDLVDNFPHECRHVIEVLAQVYANDEHCRTRKMSPEQRLAHHQAHSAAPMLALQTWMGEQLEQRLVEPNSSLGGALNYMLKRWDALTLFLRKAGAPLDNNVCERALKRAIRHRKNSLFYRNARGAEVGDIYMSLIHTCELCGVNAFEYLQALQTHVEDVQANPAQWLPWNCREQLTPPLARAA